MLLILHEFKYLQKSQKHKVWLNSIPRKHRHKIQIKLPFEVIDDYLLGVCFCLHSFYFYYFEECKQNVNALDYNQVHIHRLMPHKILLGFIADLKLVISNQWTSENEVDV